MMDADLAYSRPLAAAARLVDTAADHQRFVAKRVLLTGERAVLATANGRVCFLDSLRLLLRICRDVSVVLPPGCDMLERESRLLADEIAFGAPAAFPTDAGNPAAFDAILSVGTRVRPGLPWTTINSHGWLARVSSGSSALSPICTQDNVVGALAAASLGVGEIFKRLLRAPATRAPMLDGLSFSLDTYRSDTTEPGPALPEALPLDLLVVGAGAIGNGVVHLLAQLPVSGRVSIVDAQTFGDENLGTCILLRPTDVGAPKADIAAAVLQGPVDARPFHEDIAQFEARLATELPYPAIVVNGLDNIEARHAVQRLWPNLIIDGAIGDFSCQVSCHPWSGDVACLLCLFQQPAGENAAQRAARATGLRAERAAQALDVVTEQDVGVASPDRRDFLLARVGRPICSIIAEAMAQQLSMEQQRAGFAPSVPFVACLSACMIVSELVKAVAGRTTPLEPRFQMNVLHGPAYGLELPQGRRRDCQCVLRRRNIEQVRQQRTR